MRLRVGLARFAPVDRSIHREAEVFGVDDLLLQVVPWSVLRVDFAFPAVETRFQSPPLFPLSRAFQPTAQARPLRCFYTRS